ncbi:MAG: FecR family protein [Planctomycetes bacterium]|nr:FecR family protein [Planctomycetota bacterium]
MNDEREKLIALVLGDLPADDARELEARLATDADLQVDRALLENTRAALLAVPCEDVRDAVVQSLLKQAAELQPAIVEEADEPAGAVIRVNWLLRSTLPRVAAVAAIVFVLGVAVMYTPGVDLKPTVARVDGKFIEDGDLVESRAGRPRTITYPTGELLLDGASAVRVYSTGKYAPPRFEVERGRVVLTATGHAANVGVAGNEVQVEKGGMLAVSYDRAYANITGDGSLVEVQRMTIADVAALGEQVYGLELDISDVPENIRRMRVTFYGSELSGDEFLDSFVEAATRFGVKFAGDRQTLTYAPRGGRVIPNEEWALEIAVLEGQARVVSGDEVVPLRNAELAHNLVALNAASPTRLEGRSLPAEELNEAVVWAAAAGRGLGGRLDDVRSSDETLPGGTVIYTDTLILNGEMGRRIFKLDGPDFDFPLPGGRMGRVVQLMNNGALFEVQGEVVREFVPFGRQ